MQIFCIQEANKPWDELCVPNDRIRYDNTRWWINQVLKHEPGNPAVFSGYAPHTNIKPSQDSTPPKPKRSRYPPERRVWHVMPNASSPTPQGGIPPPYEIDVLFKGLCIKKVLNDKLD